MSPEHKDTTGKFLHRTPMAYALRTKINKWDLLKLQSFCKAMDKVNMSIVQKRQPIHWEKICSNSTSYRGLISNVYKELKKVVSRESNNTIKNGVQS